MLPSFMSQPFIRKRYPVIMDHGTEVVDLTGTPATLTFYGSEQPGAGDNTEDIVNRNGAEIVKTIWAVDPRVDVRHKDKVTLYGEDYFVNGEPDRWQTGVLDHAVIQLSKWVD